MENFEKVTHVIAPAGCEPYLTAGKTYERLKSLQGKFLDINDNCQFFILNDKGNLSLCNFKNCGHLNGQDWTIKAIELE
jgi:hypothetical protein